MKNKRIIRKTLALCLAGMLAAGMLTACGQSHATDGETPDPGETLQETGGRDDLILAIESEPPTLHPFDHKAVTAGYMNALTYNALFRLNIETLEPEPDLCAEYTQLSDTLWQFTLREGVRYHNGMTMTAEDVKASMEYARSFTTTADYTSFWTGVRVVDDRTLEIDTGTPYALTLHNLASIKIVPKALIDAGHDFGTEPIGTGPYVFKTYTLGDKLEFEAFADYFDTDHQSRIKKLVWRIIPEGTSRTIALEAGEIDVIIEPDANDLTRMDESETITLCRRQGTRVNFLTANTEKAPFDDIYVRKAINAAIDKEAVLAVAMSGEGTVALSQTPMVFEGASEAGCDTYDPALAQAYMEKSAYAGQMLAFTCYVFNDTARRAAEVIQACLLELDMEMSIESLDYATYLSEVFAGNYEIAVSGYTSGTMYNFLYGIFHSDSINAANMARWNDPEIDRLIELGRSQCDLAERDATFRELTEYINGQAVYIPLYGSTVLRAYDSRLCGFAVSASGAMRLEDVSWAE